jgi:hypothetical protein
VVKAAEMAEALSPTGRKRAFVEDGSLTVIPKDALYGWLGDVAQKLDLPLSIAYPAVLTAYSAVLKEDEILGVQCNLRVARIYLRPLRKARILKSRSIKPIRPSEARYASIDWPRVFAIA